MFEKKNSALDNTTDTDKTLLGNGNDTATPENTVSDGKDTASLSKEQISEGESSVQQSIEAASAQVDANPSEAQKEAGNYRKGHVKVADLDITIENPKGSTRSGVDADGNAWSTEMKHTYGYIRGTKDKDGDHIDVYLADDMDAWDGKKMMAASRG